MPIPSIRKLLVALGCAGATILAGCGGGGSSTAEGPPENKNMVLTGVAATGAAFAGGVVSVVDSTGKVVGTSAPVDGSGIYSVTLAEGATPVFVLVATRLSSTGDAETLVSVVESADVTTANVTPITTLIASRLSSSGDPTKLAEELASGTAQITPEKVAATVQDVKTIMAPLLAASGTGDFDPLRDSFATDGTGHDQLLDSIRVTIVPSGSSANIEIALKSGGDDQSPPTIFFTSDQSLASITADNQITPTAIAGTTIDRDSLTEEGLSVRIAALMQRLTACYGVPFEQRIAGATSGTDAVVGTANEVIAAECRGVFVDNDPSLYKHNGAVVQRTSNNQGAFTSLFRRGADGVVFSQGSYEFTRGNGDHVVGYKTRDAQGGETFGAFVARKSADGALRLVGNQYAYPGHVVAYHQRRNFVTLGQESFSYFSTGYTPQVANLIAGGNFVFDRVEVTTPKGVLLVLYPDAGQSQLAFRRNGSSTGSNFARLRAEYVDGSTTRAHPSVADTPTLVFAPVQWTDEELVRSISTGSWKFDYFLAGNTGASPDATQYYRTRSRALSIGELRAKGFAELLPALVADVQAAVQPAGQPFAGQLLLEADERATIATDNGGPGWSVLAGQMPPTSITLYGSYAGSRFNDGISFSSTARSITVPCSPQSAGDLHCFNGGPGYAAGAALTGLQLWSADSTGREYANFYAMYQLP